MGIENNILNCFKMFTDVSAAAADSRLYCCRGWAKQELQGMNGVRGKRLGGNSGGKSP